MPRLTCFKMVSRVYHGILPRFTCFKTAWYLSWTTMVFYRGLLVSKHHGIYLGLRWYFTAVYLFQNTMVFIFDYDGILPRFTCFKTPWYLSLTTMVFYRGLLVSKHHGIYLGLRWYFTAVYLFQNTMVFTLDYDGIFSQGCLWTVQTWTNTLNVDNRHIGQAIITIRLCLQIIISDNYVKALCFSNNSMVLY